MSIDEGVRLDDLQYKGLYIYQSSSLPAFTQDTVLLADFAKLKQTDNAVDLGAGTGALTLLAYGRYKASFTCVEINPEAVRLLRRTMEYNKLSVPVYELDFSNSHKALGEGVFSAVLSNPPYFQGGTKSPDADREQSRRSSKQNALNEVCCAAFRLLRHGGKFYCSYPAGALPQAFMHMQNNGLMPKRYRLVANTIKAPPYLALIMAQKGAKPGAKAEQLLFLRDDDFTYSNAYLKIYHME